MKCMRVASTPCPATRTSNECNIPLVQTHQCKYKAINSKYVDKFSWKSKPVHIPQRTFTRALKRARRTNVLGKGVDSILQSTSRSASNQTIKIDYFFSEKHQLQVASPGLSRRGGNRAATYIHAGMNQSITNCKQPELPRFRSSVAQN